MASRAISAARTGRDDGRIDARIQPVGSTNLVTSLAKNAGRRYLSANHLRIEHPIATSTPATIAMKTKHNRFLVSSLAAVAVFSSASAATLFKDSSGTDINTLANWSTANGATTPDPLSFGAADQLRFNENTAATGTFTMDLSAALSVGNLTVDSGTGNGGSATGSFVIDSANNSVLTLNGGGNPSYLTSGIVLNSGTGGTLTVNCDLALGATPLRFTTSRALTVNGDISLGASTLEFNTAGSTTTIAGIISGTGGLNKAAGGQVLALTNTANTFSGAVTLVGGTTQVTKLANSGADSSLGNGSSNIVLNGAVLTFTGSGADTTNRAIEMRSGAAINNTGTGTISFTASNVSQTLAASARTMTLGGTNTGDNTFGSILGDSGTAPNITSLTKNGVGKWILTASNIYTGTTTVSAGTLVLGNPTNTLADTGAVTIGGGTLDIGANSDTVGAITLNSGSITGTTGTLAGTSYAVGGGSISASLGGTGALAKTSANTVILSGANTYSGSTTVTAGTLVFANKAAQSASTSITAASTGTVGLGVHDSDAAYYNASQVASLFSSSLGGFTLDAASPVAVDTTNAGGSFSQNVALTGSRTLVKIGTGTLSLAVANSHTGTTLIHQGVLSAAGSGTLGGAAGSTTDAGNIVFGQNLNSGALHFETTANLGPADQIRFRNTGGTDGQGGALVYSGTTAQTLGKTIQCDTSIGIRLESNSVGGSLTFNGAFIQTNRRIYLGGTGTGDNTLATAFGGTGGITKRDAGTWILSAANTYTGNTVVSDGTLAVNSSGSLRFRPTTNGVNNAVSGSSTATLTFTGTVSLDLSAANTTAGNSWTLFNLGSFTGPTPTLTPAAVTSTTLGSFTETFSGVWELPVTGAKWVFTESDGKLVYSAGFSSWATANAPGQTISQDHDGDGVPNGVEYFAGLSGSGFTTNPTPNASNVVSWPKGASYAGTYGTDFVIQISSDLGLTDPWTNVPSGNVTIDADSVDYDLDTTPAGTRKFARLVVTGP